METIRAGNKGYFAQILVTTFDRAKTKKPDSLKFRILLVSSIAVCFIREYCEHIMWTNTSSIYFLFESRGTFNVYVIMIAAP